MSSPTIATSVAPKAAENSTMLLRVLAAISFCHLLNDMVQALLPSIYPILKTSFHLSFGQIGLITLTYQITASLLQPLIGHWNDRTARPFSLPVGMTFTLVGLGMLSRAASFTWLLMAASLVGIGSAIFHPEASRIARKASGGQHGFAQSFFQVGGNTGQAIGPLLAAIIVLPRGQVGVTWFVIPAILGIAILVKLGFWSIAHQSAMAAKRVREVTQHVHLSRARVVGAISVLVALTFSKYFYLASFTSYYTFYLMERFHVSVRSSQEHLFAFLAAVAAGTLIGGPLGDRIALGASM